MPQKIWLVKQNGGGSVKRVVLGACETTANIECTMRVVAPNLNPPYTDLNMNFLSVSQFLNR
jgi:hypothetical protein